jgi:hypothetical protein
VDVDSVLEVVTLIALAIGGYFVKTGKDAVASAANTAAEEGARAGVKAINWPRELAQELEKTRGTERQERRFDAYSALWKKLRRLALYDQAVPDPTSMGELSRSLSDWYFIEAGGLMLTTQARDFYFALQELLQAVSAKEWTAERPSTDLKEKENFLELVQGRHLDGAERAMAELDRADVREWPPNPEFGKDWKDDVKELAARWDDLSARQRFIVLQQVASILRTVLVNDVESRLR